MVISQKKIFEALKETTEKKYSGSGCADYGFLYSYSLGRCKGNSFINGWFNHAEFINSVFMNNVLKSKDKRSDLFKDY